MLPANYDLVAQLGAGFDGVRYFGATVRQALALLEEAHPGQLLVSQEVLADPPASVIPCRHSGREVEAHTIAL